ncbi:transglutaminase domain-containing protein [Agarivorans sp. 1_MG-2023]|uniref:transglutaminase domain-containing protein n=1 Tax=Agarivorans sp. 1_MG-2023 TaxID=3062634 RepID=UPI0026E31BAA|nr:transglutaminase domain-containing protein [Agarivorans sp. 1_MG-2023]MDO6763287.1 transglutaminase domain-containing protein [Agarivorans sp. 1_MG-2023]
MNLPTVYYTSHSAISDPKHYLAQAKDCGSDIQRLVTMVQQNLIHPYWLEHYQLTTPFQTRLDELQTRNVEQKLRWLSHNSKPALQPKAPRQRMMGNCRDFSLLLVSLLRSQGIAARARCGFARYLGIYQFEDHWICEYWYQSQQRWVMVDAQLDLIQQDILNIQFDPLDVPQEQFIFAGKAWQDCRLNPQLSEQHGILSFKGWPIIQGNVIRDIFALSKVELLAWDCGWGLQAHYLHHSAKTDDIELLDTLAMASTTSNSQLAIELSQHPKVALPKNWNWRKAQSICSLLAELTTKEPLPLNNSI